MVTIEVRRLEPSDDRSRFRSGDPDLDGFFHRYAGQNQFRHHIGVTYVAVHAKDIVGFITVAPAEINIDALPERSKRRLPNYPIPVLRLGRLAVDERSRGRGVGKSLLREALRLARRMRKELGCVAVVVDAKTDAVPFYERLGFERLESLEGGLISKPTPVPMVLSLSAIPTGQGES